MPIPHGFEQGVGEPEHQQVLYRLLPKEVIDAKDRRLVVVPVQDLVQLAGRPRSRPKGFSTTTRPPSAHSFTGQAGGHLVEQEGRNGEVRNRAAAVGNALAESTEGVGPVVVALDVAEPVEEPIGHGLVGVDVGPRPMSSPPACGARRRPTRTGPPRPPGHRGGRRARARRATGTASCTRGRPTRRTTPTHRRRAEASRCGLLLVAAELAAHGRQRPVGVGVAIRGWRTGRRAMR